MEKDNFENMKVLMNKTVIDWIPGQQQFCLTLKQIGCSKSQIHPQVKENCCCPETQPITVYINIFYPNSNIPQFVDFHFNFRTVSQSLNTKELEMI